MNRGTPVIVVNSTPRPESARETQLQNIDAAKTVADVIRTCLGPRAMLKLIIRYFVPFLFFSFLFLKTASSFFP
jgi:hypothetical protein